MEMIVCSSNHKAVIIQLIVSVIVFQCDVSVTQTLKTVPNGTISSEDFTALLKRVDELENKHSETDADKDKQNSYAGSLINLIGRHSEVERKLDQVGNEVEEIKRESDEFWNKAQRILQNHDIIVLELQNELQKTKRDNDRAVFKVLLQRYHDYHHLKLENLQMVLKQVGNELLLKMQEIQNGLQFQELNAHMFPKINQVVQDVGAAQQNIRNLSERFQIDNRQIKSDVQTLKTIVLNMNQKIAKINDTVLGGMDKMTNKLENRMHEIEILHSEDNKTISDLIISSKESHVNDIKQLKSNFEQRYSVISRDHTDTFSKFSDAIVHIRRDISAMARLHALDNKTLSKTINVTESHCKSNLKRIDKKWNRKYSIMNREQKSNISRLEDAISNITSDVSAIVNMHYEDNSTLSETIDTAGEKFQNALNHMATKWNRTCSADISEIWSNLSAHITSSAAFMQNMDLRLSALIRKTNGNTTTPRSMCRSHQGTEFFILFIPNLYNYQNIEMLLTSYEGTSTVQLSSPHPGISTNVSLSNNAKHLTIDQGIVQRESTVQSKGLRIKSTSPISVHVLSAYTKDCCSTGGYTALPVDMLGTKYIVVTYHPLIHSQIGLVAVADKTYVNIIINTTSSGRALFDGKWYRNGDRIMFIMNSFQTLLLQVYADLTGTRIRSNKRIGVLSGNECLHLNHNNTKCENVVEMIPPVDKWGKTFVIPRIDPATNFLLRITPSKLNLIIITIFANGTEIHHSTNKTVELAFSSSLIVYCNIPCLVVQFSYDYDPFMIVIPSTSQFSNHYVLDTPTGTIGSFANYVSLVIEYKYKAGLLYNGQHVSGQEITLIDRNHVQWSNIVIQIQNGTSFISHSSNHVYFQLIQYGYSEHAAYGFSFGFGASC